MAEISIRISVGKSIGFHRTIFNALGRPTHLHFWWGEKEKVLAVSAAEGPTTMSMAVPDYFYRNTSSPKLKATQLRKAIKDLTGWEDDAEKNLRGEYLSDLNMVIFRIATQTPEVRYE